MKAPTSCLRRVSAVFLSLLWMAPLAATAADMEIKPGVVAEIWPLDRPAATSVRRAFEICRSRKPAEAAATMQLADLEIPARAAPSLVRVRGVLSAPETFAYSFTIDGGDDAELWMVDAKTGEWRLAQREGNPVKRAGGVRMEQGVPQRFEFWTMGSDKITLQWDAVKWETKDSRRVIVQGTVPAFSEVVAAGKPADGLRVEWKQRYGLEVASNDGPNGIWGDADSDGKLNWQEMLLGTDPNKADSEGNPGCIRWEIWRGIPGQYVFDLTRAATFPKQPDEVRYLHRLETSPGYGNNYGSRLRGAIKAPADGDYTFMLIADDTAELWLGDTKSSLSRKLIARVEQPGPPAKWTRRSEQVEQPLLPEQVSVKITLRKDETRYLEILHKQSRNMDHCAVAWVLPGGTTPQVIGADALISWERDKEDMADVGLPNAWQQSKGLMTEGVDPANRGAYGDPDHDGLTNWEEWKTGSDPLKADAVETEHMLTCESWADLPGDRIKDMVLDKRFPAKPSHATLIDNCDLSDEGENYGCRLRGYLTAPDDGPHVFYIAGNHTCVLYLAESEDKFTKHVIAQTTRGTGWRAYGQNASQQSEPVILKKGQKYYIEVLFKRGARQDAAANPRDHSSVAWQRPGRLQTVIEAEFFSPYKKDPRDGDDDDLLDSFEVAHNLDPKDPTGANGAWGDPDGDLLENFREYQAGLDPQVADVHGAPGFAMWECWENIVGNLAALKAAPSFPLNPTRRNWVMSLEGPQGLGNFYGSRLRAYLIPPATGDYTFAIAGDNQCELMLSPSEFKYYKEKIAFVDRWSGFREWDTEPGQISKPIHLEAGKRYFIEALHKQDTKENHVSVGWKVPGAKEFEVIKGKALAGFAGDPNDIDDDDIPDDWEKTNNIPQVGRHADKDLDGDGLSNRREFLLGTRADKADTDGDGVNDSDEINLYHSNPLIKDTPAPVLEKTVALAQWSGNPGAWLQGTDGTLSSMARRGAASWDVEVATPGVYLVEVVASARGAAGYIPPVPVTVLIDDLETTRGLILAGEHPTRLVALTCYGPN